jgi:multisubunit Na+/H+ antiporter MnhE subunit
LIRNILLGKKSESFYFISAIFSALVIMFFWGIRGKVSLPPDLIGSMQPWLRLYCLFAIVSYCLSTASIGYFFYILKSRRLVAQILVAIQFVLLLYIFIISVDNIITIFPIYRAELEFGNGFD